MALKTKNTGTRTSDYYKPHAQQIKFHESPAIYRLYGGAKGGGKSVALLWEGINWCLRVPGCNVLLLRRSYPQLKKGLIRHFETLVPPALYGGRRNYNASDYVVSFPNGSKLFFGSCQYDQDVLNYNGHEFVFIGIDEATEFSYYIFEYLTLQNRCPIKQDIYGNPIVPCMALATNPSGIGHTWIKALFIGELNDQGVYVRTLENIRKKIPDLQNAKIDFNNYAFIPAKIYDNPAYANDEVYINKLKNTSETYRAVFLEGSWEAFENQYFSRFDAALTVMEDGLVRHLVESQFWQPKWIGIDWGFHDPCAVYWVSQVTIYDEDGQTRDVPVIYREWVDKEVGETEVANKIVELSTYRNSQSKEVQENIANIFLSPDAFAKRGSQNTVAEQLGSIFTKNRLPYPTQADDDRVGGARLIDGLLSKRPPGLHISDACEELIDTIPMLMTDPTRVEDVRKFPGQRSDGIYDAVRYALKSQLDAEVVPFSVERQRILAQCATNQERFFTDLGLQAKKKQGMGVTFGKRRRF